MPVDVPTLLLGLALVLLAQAPYAQSFSVVSPPLGGVRVGRGRPTRPSMGLDVAPQVISAFPTAEEQNECLAIVNAAVKALQGSDKANKELGKAGEVTYIMAAGRPRQGVISARFNCKFVKGATALRPGFVVPIFGKGGPSEEEAGQGGTGRGSQVAQVNVQATGPDNILELIVDVDGGWGRRLLITGNFGGATW